MNLFLLERERILAEISDVVVILIKRKIWVTQAAERLQEHISKTLVKMIVYKKSAEKWKETATQLKLNRSN